MKVTEDDLNYSILQPQKFVGRAKNGKRPTKAIERLP
jgi:hypothetical protein